MEKIDTYEGISVKVLLDSRATGLFISKRCAQRGGFNLIKLEKLILVKNVNGTGNSGGTIIYKVKVNIYFKGHVERVRMDVKRLEENDLYVKPEKYLWKTNKVNFLEVVMG